MQNAHAIRLVLQSRKMLADQIKEHDRVIRKEARDPRNKTETGRLSLYGVQLLHTMFEEGLSDVTICNLLDITSSACSKRRASYKDDSASA